MATIKDVARVANVSIATVSRVLNNKSGFSEETRRSVEKAIEELGYVPNGVARGLISKRTNTIGLLVPALSSMLVSEMVSGIERVVHEQGSSLIVCHTESKGKKTMQYLQLLIAKQVDGIIFTSEVLLQEYYQMIERSGIPLVLLSTETLNLPVPSVKVNDRLASFHATEYMIKQGHKKIGMISGNRNDMIAGVPRVEGYRMALNSHQIAFDESMIASHKGFSYIDGATAFRKLITDHPDITAIVAASDEIALGIISEAFKMGINIPEQVSVIGYDNIPICNVSIPPLTTISQPVAKMGEVAAEMVLDMISGNHVQENVIFPHEIIERQSVKKLD
ncbi:hypothetical protein JMA_28690 [Jeotgalibacillus malaysiensis]|uniref:HTH lacI-type domain-containing protein n=1 Tax=Jeotgalibacillus malaysiensis TaxID=1508404 RepID=A0A0B5AQ07_9BACL|nr:LacI family DNA-binding transcriptional regulator [Jeotgalibacillus malaysiensis]AJD92186.1 hypothetical protein JMA_28690 [Jeotgalibacillus malaysiensis]